MANTLGCLLGTCLPFGIEFVFCGSRTLAKKVAGSGTLPVIDGRMVSPSQIRADESDRSHLGGKELPGTNARVADCPVDSRRVRRSVLVRLRSFVAHGFPCHGLLRNFCWRFFLPIELGERRARENMVSQARSDCGCRLRPGTGSMRDAEIDGNCLSPQISRLGTRNPSRRATRKHVYSIPHACFTNATPRFASSIVMEGLNSNTLM